MDLINFTSIIIIILSIFQTIAGVGILVLGTPILLLMGLEMVEVMSLLLPLSMMNSLINLIYLSHNKKNIEIDKKMKNLFFLICLPGIFFGLFFLKKFNNFINFNLMVCFVIWIVIFFSYLNNKNNLNLINKFKRSMIFVTGFVHGITNSGGSLLSMLVIKSYNRSLNYVRYQIIFFYFFLALFQYLSIIFLFGYDHYIKINWIYFLYLFPGVIVGNLMSKKVSNKQLKIIILTFAFISSLFLLSKS